MAYTARHLMNSGSPASVISAAQAMKLGNMLNRVKVVFAGLTSATSHDITTLAAKAAATITGADYSEEATLPPIGQIVSLRVTAGAAAAAVRTVTDAGGTASASVATLSDNGRTIGFEAGVTGFVLVYQPASAIDMGAATNLVAP